jgi:PPOX class probable F420-dependent enzyme
VDHTQVQPDRTPAREPFSRFADARYASLRTFRRDGSTVETPVWIAPLDRSLVLFTDGTSWKVKRVRRDPRCAVAVCDMFGNASGPWIPASAQIVGDADRAERAYEALRAKYGWQMRALDFVSWLGGRIGRRVILEIAPFPP